MERPQHARPEHDSCPERQLAHLFLVSSSPSPGAGPFFPFPWTKLPLFSMDKIFSSSSGTKLLPAPSFNKSPLPSLPLFFQTVTPCSKWEMTSLEMGLAGLEGDLSCPLCQAGGQFLHFSGVHYLPALKPVPILSRNLGHSHTQSSCQAPRKPLGEYMASKAPGIYLNKERVEEALDTHCSFHLAIPARRHGSHSLQWTLFPGLQLHF